MAWKTGPHAEAPQGALCYGGEEPGTVSWWEDEGAAAAARPAAAADKPAGADHPAQAERRTK